MKKFLSLLKANTKGDFNIFKIKKEGKTGIILLVFLSFCIMSAMYMYAEMLMNPLHEAGVAYIGISLFSLLLIISFIVKGINNSQGIIFDAKDNNLLFSMPVKKNHILIIRLLKILIFDFLFELIILTPVIIKYILLTSPGFTFYITTIIYFLVLPLIPLIITCIIGYIIKSISVRFKKQKLVQIIGTLITMMILFILCYNIESIIENIVEKSNNVNDFINKLYLPIGLYNELINNFNIFKLLELILISIIPVTLFTIIFTKYYNIIINKSNESNSIINIKNKITKLQSSSIVKSLIKKELKTYFGIPIYIFNTIISPTLAILFSVGLVFKYDSIIEYLMQMGISNNVLKELSPHIFIAFILILLSMSSITGSSISLEGKKYSLLKSLPIKTKDIFLSKLLLNEIILLPAFLLSATLYIIVMKIFNYNIILILFSIILLIRINGQIGLIVNLIFPKLDFNTEVEVVKQSIAVLISMLINILFAVIIIFSFYKLEQVIDIKLLTVLFIIIFTLITIILSKVLSTYGVKRFKAID